MKIKISRIIISLSMLLIVSFGVALTLKASIGVGAWDALGQSISNLSKIKVGTITMMLNFLCILLEFAILRKKFGINQFMQIIISMVIGFGVNFFYYDVLGNFELNHYLFRIIVLIIAYGINALAGSCLMMINLGTFALEGACKVIGDKIGKPFHELRQWVDIICVILCILMTVLLHTPLTVREGSILGLLIYGPLMGLFVQLLKPFFQKYHLTDEI